MATETDDTEAAGAALAPRALLLTHIDPAGIDRGRLIPRAGIESALANGVHASISSATMFTPLDQPVDAVGLDAVIGDLLLRPDAARLAMIDAPGGWAWAPADLCWLDGAPFFGCGRHAVRGAFEALEAEGLSARAGFEIEFTLADGDADNPAPAHTGPAYGVRPLLRNEALIRDLLDALETAGVSPIHVHAEHGLGQFEVSLPARNPLDACDDVALARLIIERISMRHSLSVSFAPIPPVGAAANGMHLHLSVSRGADNLLAPADTGLPGQVGMSLIAGVLDVLPAATALLAGSEASYERLRPGRWSGASLCWGAGNREAAVRYVSGTADAGASSANIEIKPGDSTANPYLAMAAILAGATAGIVRGATAPPPIDISPSHLSADERAERGIRSLPSTLVEALDVLGASDTLRASLGDELVDLYTAVRTPRA
ncbi:glutamine synthetase [Microbacterium sp. cf046]|uniref:glutamine synthetase family protein n=1 Tax=Microbacterium sp. cf046 TaxID=1761803 RepID=UPI0008ECFABD|nr:glutamine synthetase family protein [Microbacterium sp. cf046]SFS02423.1 glutamine synthetase [Microbacterium sp. cf046]